MSPCHTSRPAQATKPTRRERGRDHDHQRRSWRSPTCPVHGDTAVDTPKIASIAADSHHAEPVAEYSPRSVP